MKLLIVLSTLALFVTSCTTMNESLELGAGMGAVAGAAATYAAEATKDPNVPLADVAMGAGIGLGLGLITSYFTHRSVEKETKANQAEETEMHFGDLPPSPFVMPRAVPKRGGN